MSGLTRVYQYIQADPNGLRHVWRDKGTGTYIAAFKTKEAALAYRDFHRRDRNKWVVPSERVSHETGKG